MPDYQNILVESHGRVGLIRLNRPGVERAVRRADGEVGKAVVAFDADKAIGAVVITGNETRLCRRCRHQEMHVRMQSPGDGGRLYRWAVGK